MTIATDVDLTHLRPGRLTVLGPVSRPRLNAMWRVRCACGVEKTVKGYKLKDGTTKSCSCLRAETAVLNFPAKYRAKL